MKSGPRIFGDTPYYCSTLVAAKSPPECLSLGEDFADGAVRAQVSTRVRRSLLNSALVGRNYMYVTRIMQLNRPDMLIFGEGKKVCRTLGAVAGANTVL